MDLPDFTQFLDEDVNEEVDSAMALEVMSLLRYPDDPLPNDSSRTLVFQGGLVSAGRITNTVNEKSTENIFSKIHRKSLSGLHTISKTVSAKSNHEVVIPCKNIKEFVDTKTEQVVMGFLFSDCLILAEADSSGTFYVNAKIELLNLVIRDLGSVHFSLTHDFETQVIQEADEDSSDENENKPQIPEIFSRCRSIIELMDHDTNEIYFLKAADSQSKDIWLDHIAASISKLVLRDRPLRASSKGWHHRIVQGSIWASALEGDIHSIKRALKPRYEVEDHYDIDCVDERGCTALHYAVYGGHVDLVRLMLSAGAYVNALDNELASPLHYAAFKINPFVASVLINKESDMNGLDLQNRTAIYVACSIACAKASSSKEPEKRKALENNTEKFINVIATAGGDMECADIRGETLLHHAIKFRNVKVASYLIKSGSSLEARNLPDGNSPLILGCLESNPDEEIITLLVNSGACTDAQNKEKNTSLNFLLGYDSAKPEETKLIGKSSIKLALYLIECGARLGIPNNRDITAEVLLKRQGMDFENASQIWEKKTEPKSISILIESYRHRIPFATEPGCTSWEDETKVFECTSCMSPFSLIQRKHHCRRCGHTFCNVCCSKTFTLKPRAVVQGGSVCVKSPLEKMRVCNSCFNMLSYSLADVAELGGLPTSTGDSSCTSTLLNGDVRRQLFGDRPTSDKQPDSHQARMSATTDVLQRAHEALEQRGEKLSKLSDKSAEMSNNAGEFANMAKSLREREEKRNTWFGLF